MISTATQQRQCLVWILLLKHRDNLFFRKLDIQMTDAKVESGAQPFLNDDPNAAIEMTKFGDYTDENGAMYYTQGREDHDYAPEVSFAGLHRFWTSICRVEIGPAVLVTLDDHKDWGALAPFTVWLDNTFRVTERKSNFWTEFLG